MSDDDLRQELSRLSNRLREQLHCVFPEALALCPIADEPWFWALLNLAPTPAQAHRLSIKAVGAVLKTHRVRRLRVDDVRTTLQTPTLRVAPRTVEAAAVHIVLLLPRLRLAHDQRTHVGKRLDALLEQLAREEGAHGKPPDVTILQSLPGVGRVVAATVVAEAARPLAERDYQALRTQGGAAPITCQSGKKAVVSMRYACNPHLRSAFHQWARVAVQVDPRCRAHYDRLRQRGYGYARALRGVTDRLLGVLVAMLKDRTLYDADRHSARTFCLDLASEYC